MNETEKVIELTPTDQDKVETVASAAANTESSQINELLRQIERIDERYRERCEFVNLQRARIRELETTLREIQAIIAIETLRQLPHYERNNTARRLVVNIQEVVSRDLSEVVISDDIPF